MAQWSDGQERPVWYDGTTLTQGIADYCEAHREEEIARLTRENAAMRILLDGLKVKAAGA